MNRCGQKRLIFRSGLQGGGAELEFTGLRTGTWAAIVTSRYTGRTLHQALALFFGVVVWFCHFGACFRQWPMSWN